MAGETDTISGSGGSPSRETLGTWSGTLGRQNFTVGQGIAAEQIASSLEDLHATRVAVLSSSSADRSGWTRRILDGVDAAVFEVFSDIPSHAPIWRTTEIAEQLGQNEVDALVSIGGGSVSDTAKGVAILLAEGGELEDHCSTFIPPDNLEAPQLNRDKLPLIAIATTLSAAEITPGGGATNAAGVKRVFWDDTVSAASAIYDTELLGDVPSDVLASTGMNALAHCIEGLYSRTGSPITDALALRGVHHLSEALANMTERPAASLAGTLATGAILSGIVISHARVGLHHAICHVLGARLGVPHGEANSVMLPYVLEYNSRHAGRAIAMLAEELGVNPDGVPDAVAQIRDASGAPARLRDVGVKRSELDQVAGECMQDRGLYFNPRTVAGPHEVLTLLEAAW